MGVDDRCLMSWDKQKARWQKMYKGKMYKVSCDQLKVRRTKEASYQAANAWWMLKLAQIQAAAPPHRHADLLDELQRRADRARAIGRHEEADEWAGKKRALDSLNEADEATVIPESFLLSEAAKQRREVARLLRVHDDDPIVAEALYGDDTADDTGHVPADRTLAGQARRYLDRYDLRRKAGNLSAGEYAMMERCVNYFRDWAGPTNPPSVITNQLWEDYWRHLMHKTTVAEGGMSPTYAEKHWKYARRFIRDLSNMGVHAAPGNLASKAYGFDTHPKVIPTFTVDEACKLVATASGQLKLHLLLMLNCGFTQGDIASLTHAEVDLVSGTITRQRVKTRKRHGKTVPTVTWRLWPKTLELLSDYRSKDATLALTTATGKPWVVRGYDDAKGKATTRDGIHSNFRHVQKRLKIDKPLKVFRKTSATLLDKHPEYGRYAQFFLGHAPDSMAATHYVQPSQERFDAALSWLGEQYGFVREIQR